jgi:succinate dehydrogenase / fumarate reductase membrane anchor subunit
MTEMRTTLGRVRGLGSAKEGVHHWWAQRLTALALIPLAVWFTASVISLAGAPYPAVAAFLGSPLNGTLMIGLLIATFYHASLGLQVVIEDYVHDEALKIAGIVTVKFGLLLLGLASTLGVLKLILGR